MRRGLIALIVVVVLAGASVIVWSITKNSSTSSTTSSTSSTLPAPIAPLTGLPDPSGQSQIRPALTVKIENIPAAMPQRGIEYADVIYEEIVEGGITRLAAIFNSHAPSEIGPIRSVRRTDKWIVWPIGGIFAYSGGAAYAVNDIATAPVHAVSETAAGDAMFRDNVDRVAPNNLYGIGPKLFALDGSPKPPPALFTYRTAGDPLSGPLVSRFVVGFTGGYVASFDWNAGTQSWDRSQFAAPTVTASGTRLSPKNVIIQYVDYAGGVGVIGAQAVMLGTGRMTAFIAGHMINGTWSRASKTAATVFSDAQGQVVKVTPGQTFVELLYNRDLVTAVPVPTTTTTSPG